DHTFALLLWHTRGLGEFSRLHQAHEWRGGLPPLRALKGLTMGIVGFGNIGRAIAHRATGFEMRVLAVDADRVAPGDGVDEVWPLDRLDEVCQASDVLAVAAPITPQSRGMIGAEQIRRMPRGSYLLAVSRGGIVDETALVDALEEGHLAGAGLDVAATEPLPQGDPLWTARNLILTPHVSASSPLTFDLVWSMLSENIRRFQRGEELINVVDKRRGW
ncbi:MAG: D-2-hydroxyacid dehydrogenase, partial [Chloroflexota bacterium]|nr:D-2-hydroxyacid dehydrogenase [Chloroflexota bacterium]